MKLSIKRFSLLFLITILTIPNLIAGGLNDGSSCANAFTYTVGDTSNLVMGTSQDAFYLEFVNNHDSLVFLFNQADTLDYTELRIFSLYEKTDCSNLTLIQSDTLQDSIWSNYFVVENLNNTEHLLVVEKPSTIGALNLSFNAQAMFLNSCGINYNLPCYEQVKNGGFEYFNVSPINGPNAFQQEQVCDWDFAFQSPGINTNANGIGHFASMWAYTIDLRTDPNDPHDYHSDSEGIMTEITAYSGENYILSCSLRFNGVKPDDIKVILINSNYLPFVPIDPLNGLRTMTLHDFRASVNSSNYQEITLMNSTQINSQLTSNFNLYNFCISPGNSNAFYDRLIIFPEKFGTNWNQKAVIHIDDVSFKDPKQGFTSEIYQSSCASINIGTECPIPGATYSWSPATGLDNTSSPNPVSDGSQTGDQTYTVTISYPVFGGGTCTTQTTVTVKKTYSIPNNASAGWLQNNVPYTVGGGKAIFNGVTMEVEGVFFYNNSTIQGNNIEFTNCTFLMHEDAKIEVKNGAFLELHLDNTIKSCIDGEYWNAIVVKGSTASSIEAHGGEISGATNGIYITDGAEANILNNVFDRNKKAIHILANSNDDTKQITIDGNTFSCSSPLLDASSNPNYPTNAIKITDWQSNLFPNQYSKRIRIKSNTFYGTGGNLYIYNSAVDADDNTFQGFNNQYTFGGGPEKPEKAVHIQGENTIGLTNQFVEFGPGQNSGSSNYFYGNVENIFISKYIYAKIEDCIANANGINYASFAHVQNNENLVSLINNTADNMQFGISVFNCSDVAINGNILDMEVQTSGYSSRSNNYSSGIRVDNTNLGFLPNLSNQNTPHHIRIQNNSILHSKIGIETNFAFAKIEGNTILDMNDNMIAISPCGSLGSPCPPSSPYGIRAMNFLTKVSENKVENDDSNYGTSPSGDVGMVGISVENTVNANPNLVSSFETLLNCNKVKNTGVGIRFSGTHNSATQALYNTMEDHTYGLQLDNNGIIGDIGSDGSASDNEWVSGNITADTYANNSNGNATTIFVANVTGYNPTILNFHENNGSVFSKDDSGNSQSLPACTVPTLQGNNQPKLKWQKQKSGNSNTILRSIKQKGTHLVHAADSAWMLEKQLLFHQIMQDSSLQQDSAYLSFKDSMLQYSGKVRIGGAFQGFASNLDYNLRQFQLIRFRRQAGQVMAQSDIQTLQSIARLCPYYDGIAVYYSRSLLHEMGYPSVENACEQNRIAISGSQRIKNISDESTTPPVFYPNPNHGTLNIDFLINDGQLVRVEVFDLLGKLVQSEQLKAGNMNTIRLLNLQQGLYIVRLLDNNQILKQEKIILQ